MAEEEAVVSFSDPFSRHGSDGGTVRTIPSALAHDSRHDSRSSSRNFNSTLNGGLLEPPPQQQSVDTADALLDFGPIAERFEREAEQREDRARQFPKIDSRLQGALRSLRAGSKDTASWKSWLLGPLHASHNPNHGNDLQDLVRYHFPFRFEVGVYVTDFKDTLATSERIDLSQIPHYWGQKPSDVSVRWIHAPVGLGPLHSTIEDLFLHAGKRGRPFKNAGRPEWPYVVLEVLNFLDRDQFQRVRDIYHHCHCSPSTADVNDTLNQRCWEAFPPEANAIKTGLLWDLKWRTTHLGLKRSPQQPDWETLPDFWTACYTDIPWQLSEGMNKTTYGPLDGTRPKVLKSDRQALHDDDEDNFYRSAQMVRDPFRIFHRGDGVVLTLSSMRGVNYIDRLFKTHLQEPWAAIFDNDVASAIAHARMRFENEGTRRWPQKSVEWFLTFLSTEIGTTPHTMRQGNNAPSLNSAYQELILKFQRRRDDHFSIANRQEPAQLISDLLVCKDELRRVLFINKKKEEVFKDLVKDLRVFEMEDRGYQLAKIRSSSGVQAEGHRGSTHAESADKADIKLPSAVEMASDAARKMARETEAFERLAEDIDALLTSVYELRSVQQRQVSGLTSSQNSALFILTVLLGIFVPFSALTSYWGMNLTDIQTTTWTQTHFWQYCGSVVLSAAILFPTAAVVRLVVGRRLEEDGETEWDRLGRMGAATSARESRHETNVKASIDSRAREGSENV